MTSTSNFEHSTPVKSCQVPCKNNQCKHNMFYVRIFDNVSAPNRGNQPGHLTPHETDVSREFGNCMLRLDRALTIKEIAAIYGVSFQNIARNVDRIVARLAKHPELKEYAE